MSSRQESRERGLSFWATVTAVIAFIFAALFLVIRIAFPENHPAYIFVRLNQNDLFFGVLFLVSATVALASSD